MAFRTSHAGARKGHYVTILADGKVWRMSPTQFRKLLLDLTFGDEVRYGDYGAWVGDLNYDFTEITGEKARDILNGLERKNEPT